METPLVSVIVPAYNYARYLPAAIDSALAQDWPAVEVIVVDDGSTDDTPAVIASYGDRIRGVRRPNGGLNAAIDTGIEHARGAYLTFLDADDTWRPERCRLLAQELLAHPEAGLVYGDMEVVSEDGELLHPSFRESFDVKALTGNVLGELLRRNHVSAGSMMVRAALREHFHPIPEFAPWQDWWIVTQVVRVAEIRAIDAPVNVYRHHGANMNLGADEERFAELLRAELPFRRWLLTTLRPGAVALDDALKAALGYDNSIVRVAQADGVPVETLVAVTDEDRAASAQALADARAALHAGDPLDATFALVRSIAHDPPAPAPRAVLVDAANLARAQEAGTLPPPVAVRRFVTFTTAGELLAEPALLTAYGAAFDADDDATLVVGGAGDPAVVQRLEALVAAAGMDSEAAADLLAVEPRDPSVAAVRLGRPVDARLGAAGGGLAKHASVDPVPRFGIADIARLRRLAVPQPA